MPPQFLPQVHNFEQHTLNIEWQHLTNETQDFLLQKPINFQEKTFTLNEILTDAEKSITPEIVSVKLGGDMSPIILIFGYYLDIITTFPTLLLFFSDTL